MLPMSFGFRDLSQFGTLFEKMVVGKWDDGEPQHKQEQWRDQEEQYATLR
jgi:hypothetical protein